MKVQVYYKMNFLPLYFKVNGANTKENDLRRKRSRLRQNTPLRAARTLNFVISKKNIPTTDRTTPVIVYTTPDMKVQKPTGFSAQKQHSRIQLFTRSRSKQSPSTSDTLDKCTDEVWTNCGLLLSFDCIYWVRVKYWHGSDM